MTLKLFSILGFFALAIFGVEAQVGVQSIPKSSEVELPTPSFSPLSSFKLSNSLDKYYNLVGSTDDVALTLEQPPLGIFCKLDKSLDQKFPFNLRFRLGEFHYTNGLEYGDELGRRATSAPVNATSN